MLTAKLIIDEKGGDILKQLKKALTSMTKLSTTMISVTSLVMTRTLRRNSFALVHVSFEKKKISLYYKRN